MNGGTEMVRVMRGGEERPGRRWRRKEVELQLCAGLIRATCRGVSGFDSAAFAHPAATNTLPKHQHPHTHTYIPPRKHTHRSESWMTTFRFRWTLPSGRTSVAWGGSKAVRMPVWTRLGMETGWIKSLRHPEPELASGRWGITEMRSR